MFWLVGAPAPPVAKTCVQLRLHARCMWLGLRNGNAEGTSVRRSVCAHQPAGTTRPSTTPQEPMPMIWSAALSTSVRRGNPFALLCGAGAAPRTSPGAEGGGLAGRLSSALDALSACVSLMAIPIFQARFGGGVPAPQSPHDALALALERSLKRSRSQLQHAWSLATQGKSVNMTGFPQSKSPVLKRCPVVFCSKNPFQPSAI